MLIRRDTAGAGRGRGAAGSQIEVEVGARVLECGRPRRPGQVGDGSDNVRKHLHIGKGEVERARADAPRVIEGVYEAGADLRFKLIM